MLLDPLRSGTLEETIPSATEVTVRISAKQDPLVLYCTFISVHVGFFLAPPGKGLLPDIGQGSTPLQVGSVNYLVARGVGLLRIALKFTFYEWCSWWG